MLHLSLKTEFHGMTETNYHVTSPQDVQYNCIAWAAGEDDVWWWPDNMLYAYWPDTVTRQTTIEAFVQAFSTKGYYPCDNGSLEEGFEKIALYAINEKPTHAARQLRDGNWTSKLGQNHDISHTIDALDGPQYGSVSLFLKRAI
jgi:hypothetical protein